MLNNRWYSADRQDITMKQKFITKRFHPESLDKIETANKIIERYQAQGLRLTLRQLYYQFVSRHNLPNTEKSYKNLASVISDGRLAGLIDWDAIEDRGRVPSKPSQFRGIPSLINAALNSYRLDRWIGQRNYAELWVEKQALAGVLEPLSEEFHVTLMVNKGYSSSSAMYDAANRFVDNMEKNGHETAYLLYIGDHDPSGEDMVRDISDRLERFGSTLEVVKIALTMDQIRHHNPPPNPAKRSDARFAAYSEKHGDESWEVDALDPATLTRLIRDQFEEIVDMDVMDAVKKQEERDKKTLLDVVGKVKWKAPKV